MIVLVALEVSNTAAGRQNPCGTESQNPYINMIYFNKLLVYIR